MSAHSQLGMTDAEYTAAVDDGSYTAFSSDSAGYGLTQWTYSTRKKALKEYADSQKASIGYAAMQAAYVYKELSESYGSVLKALKSATSCLEASNAVLTGYEKPANQGSSVQAARAKYAQEYYDKYAGTSTTASTATSTSTSSSTATKTQKATAAAKKYLKSLAGTYTVTYKEDLDRGSLIDGLEGKDFSCGTWQNDSLGIYQLYVYTDVDSCVLIRTADNVYALNFENDDLTLSFYQAFLELLSES